MIEVFNILKGYDRVCGGRNFLKLVTGHSHPHTRDHNLKLMKPRHRTLMRSMFSSSKLINKWNNLPENVVKSDNVNIF